MLGEFPVSQVNTAFDIDDDGNFFGGGPMYFSCRKNNPLPNDEKYGDN
jgi:hypothetical protein